MQVTAGSFYLSLVACCSDRITGGLPTLAFAGKNQLIFAFFLEDYAKDIYIVMLPTEHLNDKQIVHR